MYTNVIFLCNKTIWKTNDDSLKLLFKIEK